MNGTERKDEAMATIEAAATVTYGSSRLVDLASRTFETCGHHHRTIEAAARCAGRWGRRLRKSGVRYPDIYPEQYFSGEGEPYPLDSNQRETWRLNK